MVKVGKCALISLMHKKWTLRVELTKKKLATVRVGFSSKTPTKNNCLNSNTLNMEISCLYLRNGSEHGRKKDYKGHANKVVDCMTLETPRRFPAKNTAQNISKDSFV